MTGKRKIVERRELYYENFKENNESNWYYDGGFCGINFISKTRNNIRGRANGVRNRGNMAG